LVPQLSGVDGKDLAAYTKDDLIKITSSSSGLGIALFNELQELRKGKATYFLASLSLSSLVALVVGFTFLNLLRHTNAQKYLWTLGRL